MWIDSHIHIYDVSREVEFPSRDSVIYRTITAEEFERVAGAHGVTKAVAVECTTRFDDNIRTMEYVRDKPAICAVTGNIAPDAEEFREVYNEFCKFDKFRGLRMRIGGYSKEQIAAFAKNIRCMAENPAANVVDFLTGDYNIIYDYEDIIQDNREVDFVINHLAGCKLDGNKPEKGYIDFLERMAAYPNVNMKVSGLLHRSGKERAPRESSFYAPVLKEICDAFGPRRCIYGSDWPVIEIWGDYKTATDPVVDFFAAYGQATLDMVMGGNAARVYKVREV